MKTAILKRCILLLIFISSVFSADAQELFTIPRIKGEIKFDGIVNDQCWLDLKPVEMVMHTPTFGNEPTEKSEVFHML